MRRREFIALMGASATWPFTALAQQAGRTYRLGMVSPLPCEATPSTSPLTLAFQDGLRHLGFVKDQNLTFACRDVGHNIDLSSQYAAELVKGAVDVIVVFGDVAARAAQQATKTIPIVVATDDMLGEGLVSSLARPDGNTTGISILAGELDGKRQEILIEAVPGVRRIATLADSNVSAVAKLNEMQEAARARNIELSIHRVASGKEIAAAIDMAHASGSAALNVLASPLLMAYRRMIMDRVAVLHLPTMYQWPEMAEEGGLAAYGPRIAEVGLELARQIAQVFRGIKITDIPVEQPTKFELVINLKTAKAIGVTVPEAPLARADEVIE
jgi:putative tryptophan/tyrosine transport system substrate-binding protein